MVGNETPLSGWERTRVRGDEVSFRRESGGIEVAATRTNLGSADAEWELSIEHEAGDSTVLEPFGHVSDRETAVGALRSCMRAIDVALPEDAAPEQVTASAIGLGDVVRS